ncbi:uncharacterized protein LOC131182125 [Hevea brasiliensis]|uniref:uncharacterized protein LOC131182125 n=1 Tax=Hevea brasiliensis TaxID=3981 RepID=UPI002600BB00|nr:uncharacterized protein LOC131182125 [Hevea brasiliensis]
MDRSWMLNKNKFSSEYIQGVRSFLDVAKQHVDSSGRIRCPCKNCNNCYLKKVVEVKQDLFLHGFVEDYTQWTHHEFSAERPSSNHETTSSEKEVEKFARLLNDAQCELYPGCKKYSKLSFLIKMIYNKTITNSSNKSFSMNLELFKDALPEGETLPKSYYEVKKLMHDLGIGYITIDACVNDCILYWKEYEHLDTCLNPMCRAPRWKYGLGKCKKIAQKVVRYFPLKPRLQRLFMSKEIAKDMRWHKEKRVNDDVIRHPADAEAWKEFDKENDWFAQDPRNV